MLSGAPFGYRYVRKTDLAGAAYEIIEDQAALVAEMFRRYADDGASIADLARWLTGQGAPTRTGKNRWDRSVVWAMLRNPAYAGTAVFGKTMATSGTPGLNRVARLQGRSVPRAVKTVDRPREQWLEIGVPAIVDQVTFARVAQRLEDNKRFAARNTKVPSLLQGLAACSACGYACYRGHTTTSAGNKIFYYRCIGSDNYRFEHGKVCDSKPVRADYLDTVVWDHVTALLADPALIRAEISKRLEQARTADPATRQRSQLELALAKAATAITAMIEAYSEQLITIDELRTRMPHLRARETSLRGQLDALDAQAADRDAYLTLAGDLEGFLAQLRGNAATATVEDRQRVLRLLVKDILIGPEKITIRHRIPARPGSSGTRQRDPEPDTEGDHRPGSQLRWGREDAALRRAGTGVLMVAGFGEDPGLEKRLDQRQHALVFDPAPDPVHQRRMADGIEARLDVGIQHPPVALAPEMVDLRNRVLGPPPGPEPVGDRHEASLEDGLQDQLQHGLHDPVRNGRYPEPADLPRPARLGNLAFPRRQGPKRARLQLGTQVVQEPRDPGLFLDAGDRKAVDTGGPGSGVAGNPVERHDQHRRVIDEVEQVIKPAALIGRRPTVKLGLHLRYPPERAHDPRGRSVAVQRRIWRHRSLLSFPEPLPPFAM